MERHEQLKDFVQQVAQSQNTGSTKQVAKADTAGSKFSNNVLSFDYHRAADRPDDVAVIIGNANYSKFGGTMPDVVPAYADAQSMRRYLTESLGVREGNIIYLEDATAAQMTSVFGNRQNPKGKLFDWVKPGISKVYVYYAGHGAPATAGGASMLVPSDATADTIDLTGYPLSQLYKNLDALPATSVTVLLESCFSGTSQGGSLISNASPIYLQAVAAEVPRKIQVVAAGEVNQMASWEEDQSNGLFTKYYLMGVSGEADKAPYGDGDGVVDKNELARFLEGTTTYYSRRCYSRNQNVQFVH